MRPWLWYNSPMSTQSKVLPIRVAPKGWNRERADRVLAVEGLHVSERAGRVLSSHVSIDAARRKIIETIKK